MGIAKFIKNTYRSNKDTCIKGAEINSALK